MANARAVIFFGGHWWAGNSSRATSPSYTLRVRHRVIATSHVDGLLKWRQSSLRLESAAIHATWTRLSLSLCRRSWDVLSKSSSRSGVSYRCLRRRRWQSEEARRVAAWTMTTMTPCWMMPSPRRATGRDGGGLEGG